MSDHEATLAPLANAIHSAVSQEVMGPGIQLNPQHLDQVPPAQTPLQTAVTVVRRRKPAAGRHLIRWDFEKDQHLLLCLEYECQRRGIQLPWDDAVQHIKPGATGQAAIQHLSKVRKSRQQEGQTVPPEWNKRRSRKEVNSKRKKIDEDPDEEDNNQPFKGSSSRTIWNPVSNTTAKQSSGTRGETAPASKKPARARRVCTKVKKEDSPGVAAADGLDVEADPEEEWRPDTGSLAPRAKKPGRRANKRPAVPRRSAVSTRTASALNDSEGDGPHLRLRTIESVNYQEPDIEQEMEDVVDAEPNVNGDDEDERGTYHGQQINTAADGYDVGGQFDMSHAHAFEAAQTGSQKICVSDSFGHSSDMGYRTADSGMSMLNSSFDSNADGQDYSFSNFYNIKTPARSFSDSLNPSMKLEYSPPSLHGHGSFPGFQFGGSSDDQTFGGNYTYMPPSGFFQDDNLQSFALEGQQFHENNATSSLNAGHQTQSPHTEVQPFGLKNDVMLGNADYPEMQAFSGNGNGAQDFSMMDDGSFFEGQRFGDEKMMTSFEVVDQ